MTRSVNKQIKEHFHEHHNTARSTVNDTVCGWTSTFPSTRHSTLTLPRMTHYTHFYLKKKKNLKPSWLPAFWKKIKNTQEVKKNAFLIEQYKTKSAPWKSVLLNFLSVFDHISISIITLSSGIDVFCGTVSELNVCSSATALWACM